MCAIRDICGAYVVWGSPVNRFNHEGHEVHEVWADRTSIPDFHMRPDHSIPMWNSGNQARLWITFESFEFFAIHAADISESDRE